MKDVMIQLDKNTYENSNLKYFFNINGFSLIFQAVLMNGSDIDILDEGLTNRLKILQNNRTLKLAFEEFSNSVEIKDLDIIEIDGGSDTVSIAISDFKLNDKLNCCGFVNERNEDAATYILTLEYVKRSLAIQMFFEQLLLTANTQ